MTALPGPVQDEVEGAVRDLGLGERIEAAQPVFGGCINNGLRLRTDRDRALFLKWNSTAPPGMFAAEAHGLTALRSAHALRLPEPLCWGETGRWLLMEHIEPSGTVVDSERRLGTGLARLHGTGGSALFGWEEDNWIGSLEQANTPAPSWGEFWRDLRLAPQLSRARSQGYLREPDLDHLLELTPAALSHPGPPELLHGDLWGGNWFTTAGGEPVLVDPAVYRGHGEVDLAMSELFGGFSPSFYEAYASERPIPAAYHQYRKDLYQLYYLLVHVNLFGAAYVAGSLRAAQRVLAALL